MTLFIPTARNCDEYLGERTGKYEYRKERYDAAIEFMVDSGLRNGMTVVDIGSGMGEFAYCLMHDWNFNVRYIPVDGGIDSTDLNVWSPVRNADFFVALEIVEHLTDWERLTRSLQAHASIGVVISTPNPNTTDVLGMDKTHVREVFGEDLATEGFHVEERMFYGGAFSNGLLDSLFATWRKR